MSRNENNYSVLAFTWYSGGRDQYTEKPVFQDVLEIYLKFWVFFLLGCNH